MRVRRIFQASGRFRLAQKCSNTRSMSAPPSAPRLPLSGLKLVELGHYIAAPFATRLLADLGAEVIKVEPPGGDPV
ncbi:MAG: hypothetical protein RL312_1747, partial [Pseudomonadota bacterium]